MYRVRNERSLLFNKKDLREYLDPVLGEMLDEVANYDKNALLNTPTDELASYFRDKYHFDFVVIDEENITVEESETKIDVSGQFDVMWDRPGPAMVDATKITVRIPFDGQREFLYCNPNQAYMAPAIVGVVEGDFIIFDIDMRDPDSAQIKTDITSRVKSINERLQMMQDDVSNYNNGLLSQASTAIESRKERLKSDNNVVSSLGFKLHKRGDAPSTYAVPEIRRKIQVPQPDVPSSSTLEPTLANSEFTNILNVISNMVMVMERSPKTFINMDEESIRNHFLVQLNGQYEGEATGETFNNSGKTDILIRNKGKNIFVAECKFWDGPKVFNTALNQLLGYTTWRDGKLALLIFNRNKDFTKVIEQIKPLVEENEHYVDFISQESDSEFHFKLSHPHDKQKHLILAVLLFEIPIEGNNE
jgi:hypothetical protein